MMPRVDVANPEPTDITVVTWNEKRNLGEGAVDPYGCGYDHYDSEFGIPLN
jgi:hypothetical protein